MAALEESVEELKTKLEEYDRQLEQVKEVIKLQPNDQSLLKLQSDLEEVISLTKDLIAFQSQQQNNDVSNREDEEEQKSKKLKCDDDNDENDTHKQNIHLHTSRTLVGRTCHAPYNGEPYYAEIVDIKNDAKEGERVIVRFIGWNNEEEYALHQIQLLSSPPLSSLTPGATCQAIFSEDGKWYDCVILEQTNKGIKVKYLDYGNVEEVLRDRIRINKDDNKNKNNKNKQNDQQKRKIKEIVTRGGYKIPAYLAFKPTDNEAQKNSKKRRVKAIKAQQKQDKFEISAVESAESWQKFNNKATNKRIYGAMTGRKHESLFKSRDLFEDLDVIHKNKSADFIPRRKHDVDDSQIPEE